MARGLAGLCALLLLLPAAGDAADLEAEERKLLAHLPAYAAYRERTGFLLPRPPLRARVTPIGRPAARQRGIPLSVLVHFGAGTSRLMCIVPTQLSV